MILALSMRFVENDSYVETRDALSWDWVSFLRPFDILPLLVPNVIENPVEYLDSFGAKGLILTGGNDIGHFNGLENKEQMTCRDKMEFELLRDSIDKNRPVFGVCRGMQLINLFFGGSIERKLSDDNSHVNTCHKVRLKSDVFDLGWGDSFETNSYHNQGIRMANMAEELESFAFSEDGVIEGIYHPVKPIIAVQWHPERDNPAANFDKSLFESWLAKCD